MIRIAMAEDLGSEREKLTGYIRRYAREQELQLDVITYADGMDLLEDYPEAPDILLLDIDMKHSNGMEVAHRIRAFDEHVKILFITRMVQYALEGYEVGAVDYIIKPVTYELFAARLARVLDGISKEDRPAVPVRTAGGTLLVRPDELVRAETKGKHILLVLKSRRPGETEPESAIPLYQLERLLDGECFFRCHSAFLINLKYVTGYSQTDVWMGEERIPLSKHRRRAFVEALMAYHASRM